MTTDANSVDIRTVKPLTPEAAKLQQIWNEQTARVAKLEMTEQITLEALRRAERAHVEALHEAERLNLELYRKERMDATAQAARAEALFQVRHAADADGKATAGASKTAATSKGRSTKQGQGKVEPDKQAA